MEKKELKRKIKETFTYKSEDVHPGTRWKTYLLCIVLLTVLCALLVRFAYLQIIKGEEYQAASLAAAIYIVSGARGMERGTLSEEILTSLELSANNA